MFLLLVVYNLCFLAAGLFYLAKYGLRRRLNRDFLKRIFVFSGRGIQRLKALKSPVWLHAVSVGEAALLRPVISLLKDTYPGRKIVISVITPAGCKLVLDRYSSEVDAVFYLPLDFYPIVNRLVRMISPSLFVAMETEIWPSLYYSLYKKNIPIAIVNARVSDKSFWKYKLIKPCLRRVLSMVKVIGAQDENACRRFVEIGADKEKVIVSGNVKFLALKPDPAEYTRIWQKWGGFLRQEGVFVFLAASTHSGEEDAVLDVFVKLKQYYAGKIILVVCPRHIERAAEVVKICRSRAVSAVRASQGSFKKGTEAVVLDTVGDLFYFYSLADAVFVGGSLVPFGGHNILEPAFFSKPVVFGRYMNNFQEIAGDFLSAQAAFAAQDKQQLFEFVRKIMEDKDFAVKMAENGRSVLANKQRAVRHGLNKVFECLI